MRADGSPLMGNIKHIQYKKGRQTEGDKLTYNFINIDRGIINEFGGIGPKFSSIYICSVPQIPLPG
jgi:hypothetical protein